MSQSTLAEFVSTGPELPYPVPFPESVSEGSARIRHRKWYWETHDMDTYECPDCARMKEEVDRFEVHHKDRNPRNGHPNNLIALCRRCHRVRHTDDGVLTLSALTLEEWKSEFGNLPESTIPV